MKRCLAERRVESSKDFMLFTRLRFPYAQFPCASLTGDLLFHPFWQAVSRLERMEFKVNVANALTLVVGDEASETAKFVSMFDSFFDILNWS